MASIKNFLTEAVQFVPVITLASSFLVSGGVDLQRAGILFVIAGAGAVAITGILLSLKVLLNPVLVGTNLWLCVGALAFGLHWDGLAGVLAKLQAGGLYTSVLLVGILFTTLLPSGYIGMRHPDSTIVKKQSLLLLMVTGAILVWSLILVKDIRLGGGLPFILLNMTRRLMIQRAVRVRS